MDLLSSSPSDKDLPSPEDVTNVFKGLKTLGPKYCRCKTSSRPVEPNRT